MTGSPSRLTAVVTGAAGFIGSHLCERLVADGWRVRGIDAFTDYYARPAKEHNLAGLADEPAFSLVEADLVGRGWQSAVSPDAVVFHLAAQPGVRGSFGEGFARYARDNVVATQQVFEAAHTARCRRVVWASSSSVYGDAAVFPCREDGPTGPRSPYGVTKRACEDLARVYSGLGLSTVGLRYFTVYGPRQRPDMAFRKLCEAALDGASFEVYGDGLQSRDFTFVADACDATLHAAVVDDPDLIYNIGGGTETTLAQVVAQVERLAGHRLHTSRAEEQLGDVRRTAADTTAARADLGWRPRTALDEGLAAELAWCRSVRTSGRVA